MTKKPASRNRGGIHVMARSLFLLRLLLSILLGLSSSQGVEVIGRKLMGDPNREASTVPFPAEKVAGKPKELIYHVDYDFLPRPNPGSRHPPPPSS